MASDIKFYFPVKLKTDPTKGSKTLIFVINRRRWTIEVLCCRHEPQSDFDVNAVWIIRLRKLHTSTRQVPVRVTGSIRFNNVFYNIFVKEYIFGLDIECGVLHRISRWDLLNTIKSATNFLMFYFIIETDLDVRKPLPEGSKF